MKWLTHTALFTQESEYFIIESDGKKNLISCLMENFKILYMNSIATFGDLKYSEKGLSYFKIRHRYCSFNQLHLNDQPTIYALDLNVSDLSEVCN